LANEERETQEKAKSVTYKLKTKKTLTRRIMARHHRQDRIVPLRTMFDFINENHIEV